MPSVPLPEMPELKHALQQLAIVARGYFTALGDAFGRRRSPQPNTAFAVAMERTLAALQHLPPDERIVALRFALQQLLTHLDDLTQRAGEFAASSKTNRPVGLAGIVPIVCQLRKFVVACIG